MNDSKKYPFIHPEELGPPEHLAADAEDVEDFIEHFSHHDEHQKAHEAKKSHKLTDGTHESSDE